MNISYLLGVVLAVLAGVSCCFFFVVMLRANNRMISKRQLKKKLPVQFPTDLENIYMETENLACTLELLEAKYSRKGISRRIEAAKDYLYHSRYRDIETVLYYYLSDQSKTCKDICEKIILHEELKRRRLPERQ